MEATPQKKLRLDELLVHLGLVETRSKAKSLIIAGKVLVNEVPADKPGHVYPVDCNIRLKESLPFVSRGGFKLQKALLDFQVDVKDKVCLDVGASTGGFTDCLLQSGAKRVYAVDVGYGQMHWKLQSDQRVIRMDRENFRYFDISKIPEAIEVCVADVSFISLKLVLPKIHEILSRESSCRASLLICLIKPQFEVGQQFLSKGGIVVDSNARDRAVSDVISFTSSLDFKSISTIESPITGADGNIEYLMFGTYFGK
jgi:23S rRNA (cytidine1920-2'-O)/16S rRNA (cytidine1409-2'-O)-methyltransferase